MANQHLTHHPVLVIHQIPLPRLKQEPDDGDNFQQFIQCLFGTGASEEDITGALDGTGESTPTEQEIRDCFDPLYNTAGATDTTTAAGSGSTVETDDAGEDEGESSDDSGTSDDEGESEQQLEYKCAILPIASVDSTRVDDNHK